MSSDSIKTRILSVEETFSRLNPPSPSESGGLFEASFLDRVSRQEAVAVEQFAAHVRVVVRVWLKQNRPELATSQELVERVVRISCQAMIDSPERWTNPQVLGVALLELCRSCSGSANGTELEAPLESAPARIWPEWCSGGCQEAVRRLLDELPERDRDLFIERFGRGTKSTQADEQADAAYLRRLLFRARLRFRDLMAAAASSSTAAGTSPSPS